MVFLHKICQINNIDDIFYLNLEHKTNRDQFKNKNVNQKLTSELNFSLLVDKNIHSLIYNDNNLQITIKKLNLIHYLFYTTIPFKEIKLNKIRFNYNYNYNSINNLFSIFNNLNNNYPNIPCLENDDANKSKLETNFKKQN